MPAHRLTTRVDTRGRETAEVRQLTQKPLQTAIERGLPQSDAAWLKDALLAHRDVADAVVVDILHGPLDALQRAEDALRAELADRGITDATGIVPSTYRLYSLMRRAAEANGDAMFADLQNHD